MTIVEPIMGVAFWRPDVTVQPGSKAMKEESRALDRDYRIQRNETLRLKNA